MSSLKNIYSPEFYSFFADILKQTIPDFDKNKFISLIFDSAFENKELKERMRHTTNVLHQFLPSDYKQAIDYIEKIITNLRKSGIKESGLEYIFFPDYIEVYGLDDYETSVKALEFVTQFISCEFAVRPFILKYGNKMIHHMKEWSLHPSNKVRRLASEGSRPRLPWAMALPELKKNPEPILPILENLKNDSCEIVRRSVANNLNDISKDNPEIVIAIAKKWKGISKETDAIIKHSCRTLLKQGHNDILNFYDLDGKSFEVKDFKIVTPKVKIGDSLEFSFTVINKHTKALTLRLEYGIYYLKQNGSLSKKVFKISERLFQPNETVNITRKQSFKLITTRVFYKGLHKLSIILNGQEKLIDDFEII